MNATLQVLYRVPELREALASYKVPGDPGSAEAFTGAAKDLFAVRSLFLAGLRLQGYAYVVKQGQEAVDKHCPLEKSSHRYSV